MISVYIGRDLDRWTTVSVSPSSSSVGVIAFQIPDTALRFFEPPRHIYCSEICADR